MPNLTAKDIEENEKVCDTLNAQEDFFCEEELATVVKGLKTIWLQMLIVW